MYKKYRIKSLGVPLDGLIVYVDSLENADMNMPVCVLRLESKTNLFADANFSSPLKENSLYIRSDCLEPYVESSIEFGKTNPAGKFIKHTEQEVDKYTLLITLYQNLLCVTVTDHKAEAIFRRFRSHPSNIHELDAFLKNLSAFKYDYDDLLFDLEQILNENGEK